jgi:hypothetical protein
VQVLRLEECVRDVDPEAVDAAVEPEAEDRVELVLHVLVVPVEVGLLGREEVEVVLAGALVERPGRAAEGDVQPFGGRRLAGAEEVVRRCGDRVGDRVPEPRCWSDVWFGTMSIVTLIPSSCASASERVEVGERAELRVDVDVVGDVVAVVACGEG